LHDGCEVVCCASKYGVLKFCILNHQLVTCSLSDCSRNKFFLPPENVACHSKYLLILFYVYSYFLPFLGRLMGFLQRNLFQWRSGKWHVTVYASDLQPACRGTLVCHLMVSAVQRIFISNCNISTFTALNVSYVT
jgi:hypothetical protein